MNIVSFFINIIHFIMVSFVIISPFLNIPPVLLLNLSYTICLMIHWYFNSNICCLTIFEGYITGKPLNQTFIHKIIDPIYNISENSLNNVVWIVTIISFLITLYKLYKYTMSLDKITLKSFTRFKFIKI